MMRQACSGGNATVRSTMCRAWALAREGARRFGGKPRDYIACAMRLIAHERRIADYPPVQPTWYQAVWWSLAYALTLCGEAVASLWKASRLQPVDAVCVALLRLWASFHALTEYGIAFGTQQLSRDDRS